MRSCPPTNPTVLKAATPPGPSYLIKEVFQKRKMGRALLPAYPKITLTSPGKLMLIPPSAPDAKGLSRVFEVDPPIWRQDSSKIIARQ